MTTPEAIRRAQQEFGPNGYAGVTKEGVYRVGEAQPPDGIMSVYGQGASYEAAFASAGCSPLDPRD